jgi:hypothetical protein
MCTKPHDFSGIYRSALEYTVLSSVDEARKTICEKIPPQLAARVFYIYEMYIGAHKIRVNIKKIFF